jgi:ADP-ribosyl-[dinitrogen reductase] hydrolase
MSMNEITNRRRGCLIGLAVGDALGAAVEFQDPGTFQPVTGYRAGGPHGLAPGEWTDDTSMALALADSIGRGWDINDQINRYIDWYQNGKYSVNGFCFDIGTTTRYALEEFIQCKDARTSGDHAPEASGNGGIMRLAPVPIAYFDLYPKNIRQLATYGEESSLPTHASGQCLSAARYLTIILAALINGEKKEEILSSDWSALRELEVKALHGLVFHLTHAGYRHKSPPEIQGKGWVIASLEAALWAFHNSSSFEEAVLKAVNLGDDADTTGAICGQLAGAYWGESSIPADWRLLLAKREMIEEALRSCGVKNE